MKKTYNKLVRDNIPSIIEKNGGIPTTRILDDKEYKKELENKLLEEYKEVLGTDNKTDRLEELADMLELISALAKVEGSSLEEVIEIAKIKANKRGGFDKKIYLESVEE